MSAKLLSYSILWKAGLSWATKATLLFPQCVAMCITAESWASH